MEAALSQLSTKIITMLVLFFVVYIAITFAIHKGLKKKIKDYEIRKYLVSIVSVVAFSLIAYFIMA